ncbi:calmodulin-regulated spectrin-associated protein 1-like isoform X1 [Asterias rubens]|uniref:calmodulin-regulated spectrin-associated protein 1-like isoform X1 n=1 Tax=Asterias rubens TaxID=7604 RepID=UPI0014553AD5|nr:calmodulin-regulated spectrin-associated protein 1-like isoform X1 [Asterias rubens]XP_033640278.1 calmodulin-regulated spectrin-associated protein 1-like isoform X1 [Asterias rubens]
MASSYGHSSRNSSSSSAHSYKGSSNTPEILPVGQYNSKKAKLCASIRWLVCKAYSSSTIPPDIRTPFFKDKEGEDHLRPAVIYQLSSGELYSRACASIFPPSVHQWQGHWSVIQGLARRGIYVTDDKRIPVTEAVLTQTQRIKLNAHLAVMDAIMTAFTGEVVNIEKIVQAVRRITTFNASSELPFDLENALIFWVNKVCTAEIYRMERERRSQQEQQSQAQVQKVRMRRQQLQPKEPPCVPTIKNVTKDISDGRCLCLLIHHYCPHLFSLDDVDLRESVSFAESVHNLEQIEAFLEKNLPDTHHFTFEDLLYSPEVLRVNILALFSELFHYFEVERPPHLDYNQEQGQKVPATPEGRSRVQQLPPLPISSATKKSFQSESPYARSELRSAASNPEVNRINSGTPQRSHSLLIQRDRKQREGAVSDQDDLASIRRASSLENLEAKQSILAWQGHDESRDRSQSMRDSNTSSLLANVSIDSDLNDSQSFSELNSLSNRNGRLPKVNDHDQQSSSHFENEDDLEVESLTSALSRISQRSEKPVARKVNEELEQRASTEENGRLTDPEFTVTPLSSMSSKDSSDWNRNGQSDSRRGNGNHSLLRNETFRTANNREFEQSVEQEVLNSSVTPSRRRLKLDIQPVEMKRTERLLPAVVKPLKEKSNSINKKEESGEGRRTGRNPREDHHGRLPDANGGGMTTWSQKQGGPDQESPESLDATTPLSGESIADSLAGDYAQQQQRFAWQKPRPAFAPQGNPTPDTNSQEPHVTQAKHGEAFFIHTHLLQPEQSVDSSSLTRTGTGSSFTVSDKQHTASTAFEAGIPVVSSLAELQGMEDEDEESYNRQASPRHSSAHPNLHAAPSQNPNSASHPTERFSSNPHPYPHSSPRTHDQSNPHVHETAFKPNALHSGGDGHGISFSDSPRVPNAGMVTSNDNIPQPSSMETESSKLHADETQKESGDGVPKPVLMTFDTNLSPNKVSTSISELELKSTSSLANADQDNLTEEKETEKLEPSLLLDTNLTIDKLEPSAIPNSSLVMHSKADLTPSNQPIIVENSCMPLDSANHELDNQVLTTWGANSKQTPLCGINTGGGNPSQHNNQSGLGEFSQLRAKLEEKRRFMDSDKRKLERQWSKQRQRIGKAAFMQVLANQKKPRDNAIEDQPIAAEEFRGEKPKDLYSREEIESSIAKSRFNHSQQEGKITFADLGSNKEKLVPSQSGDSPRIQKPAPTPQPVEVLPLRPESPQSIPDIPTGKASPGSSSGSHSPHMTSDEYNNSLEKLNANLSQLQNEIQRLSLRQEQMRSVMESPRPPSERSISPQQAPPVDSKPFVLHSGSEVPPEPSGFYLSQADKEPESFVLHENPLYDMAGAEIPSPRPADIPSPRPADAQSPRPVGPVQRLPPQQGLGSITRSIDQSQVIKSPYPANQVPSKQPDNTYIIPPSQPSPIKNNIEISKNDTPQNQTKILASTPANEQPRNADSLTNQHQPPLPTVASLSNQMAEISKIEKSPDSPDAPKVQKRQRNRKDSSSSTQKKRNSVYDIVGEGEEDNDYSTDEEKMVVRPLDLSGNISLDVTDDSEQKAKGFVVAAESDQADEVEKRKMQFLQNRLKKQEEERAKRASREADMEKKREQQRRKQDEMEAKKAEEKARREQIRLNYQKRKLQEQQENEPPAPVRRTKSSSKPRPKSCVVDDQTDYARPATSRYGHDKDIAEYKKNEPEPTTSPPNQQTVPPETKKGAVGTKIPKAVKKSPPQPSPEKVAKQPTPESPKVIKVKEPNSPEPNGKKEKLPLVKGHLEEKVTGSCAASVVSLDSSGSGGGGAAVDYQGPKLYVKPTTKSNRHIITNAISHCVLAGEVNKDHKDKVLEELAKADAKHFIILFRDAQLQFRSVYSYSPDTEELWKLFGVGPRHITQKMYENLYKYNSGSKQFSKIPSKTMSVSVDGLTIGSSYWLSKKGPPKKR